MLTTATVTCVCVAVYLIILLYFISAAELGYGRFEIEEFARAPMVIQLLNIQNLYLLTKHIPFVN